MHLGVCVCVCVRYILNQKDKSWKFEAKTNEGFFLGYSNESKSYWVFNINSQIVEESIHVMFDDESYTNIQLIIQLVF